MKFCTDALRNLAREKNLTKRTIDCFWRTFSSYKVEEEEEYKRIFGDDDDSLVCLNHARISLRIDQDGYGYRGRDSARVVVSYDIWFDEKYIGGYHTVFSFDGEEILDDVFFSD
jgi:hypothetical protein